MRTASNAERAPRPTHIGALLCCLLFAGCSTTPQGPERPTQGREPSSATGPDFDPAARVAADGPSLQRSPQELAQVPNAVPRKAPRSRYGNPDSYEIFGRTYSVMKSAEGFTQKGYASWYGRQFHGKRTSSGKPYNMYAMTAAHREIPLPSWAEVTNLENGRSIVVKINDRGPFVDPEKRIIDLSYAAAVRLGMADKGTAPVKLKVIASPPYAHGSATLTDSEAKDLSRHRPSAPESGLQLQIPNAAQVIASATRIPPHKEKSEFVYLQAGAFSSRENAEETLRMSMQVGHPVEIEKLNREQGVLYRVKLGPIRDLSKVEQIRAELAMMGIDSFPLYRYD